MAMTGKNVDSFWRRVRDIGSMTASDGSGVSSERVPSKSINKAGLPPPIKDSKASI